MHGVQSKAETNDSSFGRRSLLPGATFSTAQVLFSGVSIFLLYRLLLSQTSLVELGLWGLIVGAVSFGRLSDLGFSAGIVRSIAQLRGATKQGALTVETALVSSVAFVIVFAAIAWPLAILGLRLIIPVSQLELGFQMLPWALVALVASVAVNVLLAGLEGLQRFRAKSLILMLGSLAWLGFSYLLVPVFGILGVVFAQILQQLVLFLVAFSAMLGSLPMRLYRPRWNLPVFREMLRYGLSFQAITIGSSLFDPAVKAMTTAVFGLELAGFYEVGNRAVQQVRNVVAQATRVLLPAAAAAGDPREIRRAAASLEPVFIYVSLMGLGATVLLAPLISFFLFSRLEHGFVVIFSMLCVGWLPSIIAAPPYFMILGAGSLRPLMLAIWAKVVVALAIQFLPTNLGGEAVLGFTVVLAVSTETGLVLWAFWTQLEAPVVLFKSWNLGLIAFVIVSLAIGYALLDSRNPDMSQAFVALAAGAVVLSPIGLSHPGARKILGWVRHSFGGRN